MQTNFPSNVGFSLIFVKDTYKERKKRIFIPFFVILEEIFRRMTTKSQPVYRNGRKFYVTAEEYHRVKSEERLQRRAAGLRAQNLPISHRSLRAPRSISTSSYAPVQRSQSNPYEYQYAILRTPYVPLNTLTNFDSRNAGSRLSRSPNRKSENFEDSSSLSSSVATKIRSNSSDKLLDLRQSNQENDIKRSLSTETSLSKSKQHSPSPSRRPVPTTISDYGIAPISTTSMTSNDQSQSQTIRSKMRNYFAGIKQSSLNSPAKFSTSAHSGTGSIFESGMQGSDHVYTVLGSSNRRLGRTHSPSDLLSHSDYPYTHDTASGVSSFTDGNSSSLLALMQRRPTEINRPKQGDFGYDNDVEDVYQIRDDLGTSSTIRSQSSDGLLEKKRVRFADREGLPLESNGLKSSDHRRLLNRGQYGRNISDSSRGQAHPFQSTLHQPTTTKRNGSRLATDV